MTDLNAVLRQVTHAHKRLKKVNDQLEKATQTNADLMNKIDLLESEIATKNSMVIDLINLINVSEVAGYEGVVEYLTDILYDVPQTSEPSVCDSEPSSPVREVTA